MPEDYARQSIIDEEHLKLLSLGYLISAAISAFYSLFGLFYVLAGGVVATIISRNHVATAQPTGEPPAFIGWIFAGVGLSIFLFLLGLAAIRFQAARCIKKRKSRTFCMVVGAISCLEVPFGTILGVLTFLVLGRASVERMFESRAVLS